ncbi:GNAT family N-acetyltransferase [Enterobacter cloacae]|uniref:GNAT family N-acetyltransferase n=1 Tax=Enterobacter cloacae TaxID=550 RepID=UPI00300D2E82
MNTSLQIKTLTRDDILTHLDALADILENCVRGGASVSFMLPFSTDKARAFWQDIAGSVERNERVVLACIDSQDGVIGTVQLITDQPENQPHRADVAKLLVLDTSTGSGAETFYQRAGWQKVGEIPRYALMPDGAMTATSVFYKFL